MKEVIFACIPAILAVLLSLSGCTSTFTPEMVEALAKDSATFCLQSDIRGGAGSIVAPTGGYGQSTLTFCRSNQADGKASIAPDGSILIEHGAPTPEPAKPRSAIAPAARVALMKPPPAPVMLP